MYAQKRVCGGITTLLAWHNKRGHSLIGWLYLAIIASNDYSEYVYHTMSPIIDFNSCSALGPSGSERTKCCQVSSCEVKEICAHTLKRFCLV